MEDLSISDGGKHDYDWLLTPPGTPLGSKQASLLAPTPAPSARSTSAPKASRISSTHTSVSVPSKPTRSTSTTRPSTVSSNLSASSLRPATGLSTSSISVTSRPSTPNRRTSLPGSQSTPATPSRTKTTHVPSRPSTPTSSRSQNIPSATKPCSPVKPTAGSTAKTASSRPSTPNRSRPLLQTPIRTPSPTAANRTASSRNSTPNRHRPPVETPIRSPSPTPRFPATASPSSATAAIHARSASPKLVHNRQSLALPDFPMEAPPNLRTAPHAERPTSASRSRPSSAHGIRNAETAPKEGATARRPSPPARVREHSAKDHALANGHNSENNRNNSTRISSSSRTVQSTADTNGGFGRTISKKSMDVALRHMDIRHGSGNNTRTLSGSSLFPQSVRQTAFKIRPAGQSEESNHVSSRISNGKIVSENGHAGKKIDNSENEIHSKERSQFVDLITERLAEKMKEAEQFRETDISVSTRYDSFLLKEDLKNTEWLHSLDDRCPIFDQRFDQLHEPFSFT